MNTAMKVSKDTILMSALLAAALMAAGAAAIHSDGETHAREAALMVVKSAALIAEVPPVVSATVPVNV